MSTSSAGASAAAVLLVLTTGCSSPGSTAAAPPAANSVGAYEPVVGQAGKDAVWVPTPDAIIERMLDFAAVKPGDRVVDLGSGDGKIAIAAARRGAISTGIEYDPALVELSRRRAAEAGVANVRFVHGDIFKSDFSYADVVTMYLLPDLNLRLRPMLLKMKPGTRIASHNYNMGDWAADDYSTFLGGYAYHWRVPADVAGHWQFAVDGEGSSLRVEFTQKYQQIDGRADWGANTSALQHTLLSGGDITFVAADANGMLQRFTGTADHDGRMQGQVVSAGGVARQFTATRTGKRVE